LRNGALLSMALQVDRGLVGCRETLARNRFHQEAANGCWRVDDRV
jgi:hypothetical protein